MRQAKQCYELLSQLSAGKVYQWRSLKEYSPSAGRDVKRLIEKGLLRKVGPGLYLSPKMSRFGDLPAEDSKLVEAFLKTNDFLMVNPNLYNSLGVGLTQLKNETVVYNKKRYEVVKLSGRKYNFKRPNNGYPSKLTAEFLLVDLVNNIDSVGESPTELKQMIVKRVKSGKFDTDLLLKMANKYGKVGTRKFFNEDVINKDV